MGAAIGSVFVRWAANGILVFFGSVAVALLARRVARHAGERLGVCVARSSPITRCRRFVTWSLPVTAVAAIVGYALMRRATPRT